MKSYPVRITGTAFESDLPVEMEIDFTEVSTLISLDDGIRGIQIDLTRSQTQELFAALMERSVG